MKKLFVALVVAALFAPLSFAEEVKKKDSFAGVGTPTNFAMAIASTKNGENTCYNQGDIGIDKNGLILSCQSDGWKAISGMDIAIKDASGYTKLPSGVVFQWGKYTGKQGNENKSFWLPFSNAVFSVTSACSTGYETISKITVNGFSGRSNQSMGDCTYLAVGW